MEVEEGEEIFLENDGVKILFRKKSKWYFHDDSF